MQISPHPVPNDLAIPVEATLDTQQLCKRFDAELRRVPDRHALVTHYVRSPNRRELLARGRDALAIIVQYLETHGPCRHEYWPGWAMLLSELETLVHPRRYPPQDLSDMHGWIDWAHSMAPYATEV